MGICNDDCDCLVTGDRGILVTGTGDPDTPYIVSPDSSRNTTLYVATRDDLPTLADADTGTFAEVGDTGIMFVWFAGQWEPVGPEWSRADIPDGFTVDVVNSDTIGFVLAGRGAFAIWAKGWFDVVVPAGTPKALLGANLIRTDTSAVLDAVSLTLSNYDVGDQSLQIGFSLLATIGLGAPTDVTGIVLNVGRDAASDSATLNNARIFAERLSFLDTTTAYP